MSVVEEIQNQQLAGPNARAFDPKAWLERGAKSGCSDEDLLIIAIGMLFSSGLDELRKRLSFISRKAVPSGLKQLSFISLCNRECLLAEVIAGESVDQINVDKVVSIDKLALQQMEIAGGRYLPSEICETAVDISTALLRMCPAATAETLASLSDQPWDEIARDFRVANAYVCIEDLWMSVVWNGVRLMKHSPFVFAPKNEEAERIRVVSEHRYLLTIVQRFNIRFLNMKRAFDSGELAPTPINQLVARIENDGEVAISAALAGNDFAAYSATVKSLVPNYYRKMAMDGAPEDCDLSLMLVVDAYLLLMGLAQSIAQPAIQELKRERKEDDYQASWAKLAPSIPAPALIEAIEGGLNIPKLLAEKLIKFLTFRGMGKKADNAPLDELWSSPFVQTSEETFALCVHPLLHPNFQWLIDVWLKRLGFPLDFRGNEFEQFARSSIALRVVNSSLKSSSQICTSSFEFTPTGGREEEIDLLMVLGDKVVVGEIKCFLQPVSPVDRKNHRT